MSSGLPVFIVDWVVSVKIGVLRDSIGIACPQCSSVVFCRKAEGIGVLAQTVEIR